MKYWFQMIIRTFWRERIEEAWKHRSLIWLSGVRRAGKTTLCQMLPDTEYFDCELPRVRRLMDDPQDFLRAFQGRRMILDEIHRLQNPSELLKIAADHYPKIKIIATGSSSLQASQKFKDTLTGRKTELWLTPMIRRDLVDFKNEALNHRLLFGGLPPFYLNLRLPERDYQEWMDSYWSKDIQELFRLERRASFQKFFELLLAQSGGIFEASAFAVPCEVSRPTISNYLKVMEVTRVCHVIKPFSTHRATEIVLAAKVYGFDTGFVCYHRGWHELRSDDKGSLWEHIVLNEIQAVTQGMLEIRYWRDKRGHEIDFVLKRRGRAPIAVECKSSTRDVEVRNLAAFRRQYKVGENWMVAIDADRSSRRTLGGLSVEVIGVRELTARLEAICAERGVSSNS